ncbi:armadillo-type protein [Pelomyxa schiedti]|nr:armadillo-type protein [Pelomyxa schiedti]
MTTGSNNSDDVGEQRIGGLLLMTLEADHGRRGEAEAALSSLSSHNTPALLAALDGIISRRGDSSVSVSLRLAAAIAFKRIVDSLWVSSRQNITYIPDEQKELIRRRLLLHFDEPSKPVATQLALAVAQISRSDFPKHWPTLLTSLLGVITNPSSQTSTQPLSNTTPACRALFFLYHVVSVLASRNLPADRRAFCNITREYFPVAHQLWLQATEYVLNNAATQQNQPQLYHIAGEMSVLSFKVLRRFIVWGITDFTNDATAKEFFSRVYHLLVSLVRVKNTIAHHEEDPIEELLLQVAKLVLQAYKKQPLGFVPYLGPFMEYYHVQLCSPGTAVFQIQKFKLLCLHLLKQALHFCKYTSEFWKPLNSSDSPPQALVDMISVVNQVFSGTRVTEIFNSIIACITITQTEMEEWLADPEAYIAEQTGGTWEFSVKPCAEALFLTLMQHNPTDLCAAVLPVILPVISQPVQDNWQTVLHREAIYNIVGLAPHELSNHITFTQLFNRWGQDFSQNEPWSGILRRRIVWAIGKWILLIPRAMRHQIYQLVVPLIQAPETALALTSLFTLRHIVDDIKFEVGIFLPFLEAVMTGIFRLIDNTKEGSTKLKLLGVMNVLVIQVGDKIVPYCNKILEYLSKLWQASTTENFLRTTVLEAMTSLSTCVGTSVLQQMGSVIYAILQYTTDPDCPEQVFLLEDALQLWHTVLIQTSTCPPELLQLYPRLPKIMEATTEHSELCSKIAFVYVMIGGPAFVDTYGGLFVSSTCQLMNSVADEAVQYLLQPMTRLIELLPPRCLTQDSAGFLAPLLQTLVPRFLNDQDSNSACIQEMCIFSWLLLNNPGFFHAYLKSLPTSPESYTVKFLTHWFEKTENIGDLKAIKLNALALCNLLLLPDPSLLSFLEDILSYVSFALSLISNHQSDTVEELLGEPAEGASGGAFNTSVVNLCRNSVIVRADLRNFLTEAMNQSAQVHTPTVFKQALDSVDPIVISHIQSSPSRS